MSAQPTERHAPLWMALPAIFLLCIPLASLIVSTPSSSWTEALGHPLVQPALWLSIKTSLVSLALVILIGVPLAWWLSRSSGPLHALINALIDVPIVLPPAVIGVALLLAFGRSGFFGSLGAELPFTSTAVVLAQVIVSAPFFIKAATLAFRAVDPELILVARTLGHPPRACFIHVTLPIALPGLLSGAGLAWARALGEFGATLIFAGNLPGVTQTMPLAIYSALESDIAVAQALALTLALIALTLLASMKLIARLQGVRLRSGGTP